MGGSSLLLGDVPDHLRLVFARGEDLAAVFGHQKGMFELCRPLPVRGHGRPLVGPRLVVPDAHVDHGLDGEDVAGLHDAGGLVLRVVRHVRQRVEQLANAVAAVRPHHGTPGRARDAVHGGADVAVARSRLYKRGAGHQTFERSLHELDRGVVGLPDDVRLVQVAVEAVFVDGDVDVDDVAFDKLAEVGDAVADDFVDRRTNGTRKVVVVQRRRVRAQLHRLLKGDAVDFGGGSANLHGAAGGVQHLPPHLADGAHALDFLWRVDADGAVPLLLLLGDGLSRAPVVWLGDVRRELAHSRDVSADGP
mmetsp:Transcript_23798/g.81332  ORF Transcript_23798/g.81332 Transcript_23798/m.81332 type:complete len:306 (+) Transcript_23798:95-1012(+)